MRLLLALLLLLPGCFTDPPSLDAGTGTGTATTEAEGSSGDAPTTTEALPTEGISLFSRACNGAEWFVVPGELLGCTQTPAPPSVTARDALVHPTFIELPRTLQVVPPNPPPTEIIGAWNSLDLTDFEAPTLVVGFACGAVNDCGFNYTIELWGTNDAGGDVQYFTAGNFFDDPTELLEELVELRDGDAYLEQVDVQIIISGGPVEPGGEHAFIVDPRIIEDPGW